MSKKFFEKLGKKLDVFANDTEGSIKELKEKVEKVAKDSEVHILSLKDKAEVLGKDFEEYIEKVSKDLEPVFEDIKKEFEKDEVKTFIFKIKGDKKYKVKFLKEGSVITVRKKDSQRVFKIYLDQEKITNKKINEILENVVISETEVKIIISKDLLKKI